MTVWQFYTLDVYMYRSEGVNPTPRVTDGPECIDQSLLYVTYKIGGMHITCCVLKQIGIKFA